MLNADDPLLRDARAARARAGACWFGREQSDRIDWEHA